MKKLLIAIVLIGLTATNVNSQNLKNCTCVKKTHHKATIVHHGAPLTTHSRNLPPYITVLAHVPNLIPVTTKPSEPCYTYRQHNIVVEECPSTIYKSGDFQYIRGGVYTGYYPNANIEATDNSVNPLIAPQHTVINNYKGVAPADGNSCNDCAPQ